MAKKEQNEKTPESPMEAQEPAASDWDNQAGGSANAAESPEPESVQGEWGQPVLKTVSVEIQIKQHTGIFNPDIAKILIYGESGTGKTRLGSTFPDVVFADIDKGMSSVTEKVDASEIDEFKQLEAFYQFLKSGNHSYKTLVLDTLNEMQRVAMHATVEDFPAIRRAYDDLPSQSDYGKMLHDMVELTRDFIALPMRVVLLSQVITRAFDSDVLQPQLIGKNTSREICRKMDVIGYIYKSEKSGPQTDKKVSEIVFDASEYVTKDRSNKLPAVLSDPSYSRISAFWR